jgi:serine/threonine-protein kinase RsbW
MVVALRNTISEVYPATAESVPCARRWATNFAAEAGANQETVNSVRLAVSEAVTNVVMHAYAGAGEFQLTVAVAEKELWVLVADDGRGHQRIPDEPGLGWGLPLIADAADRFVITERSGGGTELRMHFALDSPVTRRRASGAHQISDARKR